MRLHPWDTHRWIQQRAKDTIIQLIVLHVDSYRLWYLIIRIRRIIGRRAFRTQLKINTNIKVLFEINLRPAKDAALKRKHVVILSRWAAFLHHTKLYKPLSFWVNRINSLCLLQGELNIFPLNMWIVSSQ